MKRDSSHIRKILVVSNTHWDREFRHSFEKTRRHLLDMLDTTLDILEKDPDYPSFTMDGHGIMVDDYLEMRPERRPLVEKLVQSGRLILGPYYTLAEEFSVGHEALVRNMIFGRKTVERYGGKTGTVAYTPSSWGQTGQLPQILADFGLQYMMFYRGVSHHECDAEWIWAAPDGTRLTASRFAIYARYNWYYQVHRPVTTGRVFAIFPVPIDAGSQVFSWPSRAQRLYTVITTDDLAQAMTNRADFTDRPGTDGVMSYTNDLPTGVDLFGVRVRKVP